MLFRSLACSDLGPQLAQNDYEQSRSRERCLGGVDLYVSCLDLRLGPRLCGERSEPTFLRPHEAEVMMGMPRNCTKHSTLTPIQRLRVIGNSFDVNTVSMLLSCMPLGYTTKRNRAQKAAESGNNTQPPRNVSANVKCKKHSQGKCTSNPEQHVRTLPPWQQACTACHTNV